MKTDVQKRLGILAKTKERSVRSFELKCGLSDGYISTLKNSISGKMLDKILETFPDVNPKWVKDGEGEMLLPPQEPEPETMSLPIDVWNEIKEMTESIHSQQMTIQVQAQTIQKQAESVNVLLERTKDA